MLNSKYRTMWLIALFDLPTNTKKERKDAMEFRKYLLTCGFSMMQYSVYIRYCSSREKLSTQMRRIKNNLPYCGEVRLITITDVQFGNMEIFSGSQQIYQNSTPEQIEIF